jgi:aspartate carbamoyltransferase catalytic subunit
VTVDHAGVTARETGASSAGGVAAWPHRHLLDVDVVTRPQIGRVMDLATEMREIVEKRRPRSGALAGVGVTNLFYEASTRTRVSFEVAAKHLSADVVNVAAGGSASRCSTPCARSRRSARACW